VFRQVASAREAATKVQSDLANLNSTLKNIEEARPFDQLTVRLRVLFPNS
jgi:F-type H+-transporting ATPase subunit d